MSKGFVVGERNYYTKLGRKLEVGQTVTVQGLTEAVVITALHQGTEPAPLNVTVTNDATSWAIHFSEVKSVMA